jgi:hypothetical protein
MASVEELQGDNKVSQQQQVKKFEEEVTGPLISLRAACVGLSTGLHGRVGDVTKADWYRKNPKRGFEYVAAIHKLRLYLNDYSDEFSKSALSRVNDQFSINMWILFFTPFVKDILAAIKDIWENFGRIFLGAYKMYDDGWKALGRFIINMPCRILAKSRGKSSSQCKTKGLLD